MATEEVVGTKLKLEDQASGPLAKVAEGYDAVDKRARAATRAAEQFSKKAPAMPKTAPGGQDPEQARFAEIRAETRARRARTRGLKLEEQQDDIRENAAAAASRIFGGSQNVAAAKIIDLANTAESLGFQMSAFGGSLGTTGRKIVQLAGNVGIAGAAFGIIYESLTRLDEKLGITDWLSGSRSAEEVAAQNSRVAQALGFNSVEQMNAAQAARTQAKAEADLSDRIAQYQRSLPVIPAEKSGQAFVQASDAALRLAKTITPAGGDVNKSAQMILAAAENSSATWQANANKQAELTTFVDTASKSVLAVAPPLKASEAEVKNFNANIKSLADTAVASGMSLSQVPAFIAMLTDKLSATESVSNVFAQFEKTAEENAQVESAFKKLKLPAVRASDSLELLHLSALQLIKQTGVAEGFTPEMTRALAEKAFSKIDMAKSKLSVNFNNSRFDIKQNFAEGFDPDRIAVAFTQDIVALGETRLQSGLAPVYSGR